MKSRFQPKRIRVSRLPAFHRLPYPSDHVLVIGYLTIRLQPNSIAMHGCHHDPFQRGIIVRPLKQLVSTILTLRV
jgi:hypothetical protein